MKMERPPSIDIEEAFREFVKDRELRSGNAWTTHTIILVSLSGPFSQMRERLPSGANTIRKSKGAEMS
jgi:hypothetical protein